MSIQHMQMVFDAGGLASGEKSILLAYCNFTDAHGYCWPGVERIADMTGFSDRGVKKLRKALIERGLLATSSRVNAQGVRTTNITRVNLAKLAAMRMPEKTYKDNVVHELEFKDDTASDQPKGTTDTDSEQPKCTEFPDPGNTVPHKDGEHSAPYPSGGPSGDPSSSSGGGHAEPEPAPVPEKKTKSPESIVIERLGCTKDEARMVVDYIEQQGTSAGEPIRNIVAWVTNRPDRDLSRDLAHVRRHSAAPTVTECGIHGSEMKPYGCDACAGEIKAGDPDDIARLRAHLAAVGEKVRPDLARLLGTPQTAPAPRTGGGDVIDWRRIQKKRSDVVGGSRAPVADHAFYSQHTDEELRARFLG